MRFLVDMTLSLLWIARLRVAGHDATYWSEVGEGNAPGVALKAWAEREGAVVFTHDRDFGAILAHTGASGPSAMRIREQDVDPEAFGMLVVSAIEQCRDPLERGALVTVDLRRAKARVLPIRREGGT